LYLLAPNNFLNALFSLKHPQAAFLPHCDRPCFTPTTDKTTVLYIFIFIFMVA
jgi:hypothetical protein